jgi:hypothetical protein
MGGILRLVRMPFFSLLAFLGVRQVGA